MFNNKILNTKKVYLIVYVSLIMILFSCNSARKLQSDQFLLKRNKITVNDNTVNTEGVKGLIKQNPNKKFLWLKLKLAFYNLANQKSDKWPSSWLKNIGEPPVILDTNYTNNTLKQISIYLDNHGYFKSKVEKSIKYKRNKKAVVTYNIIASPPYILRNINYIIHDDTLKNLIMSSVSATFIKSKDNYDIDNLDKERDRIASYLKNSGYYAFTKEFIIYKVDSNLNNKSIDLTMIVKNPVYKPSYNPDTLVRGKHKRYTIKSVYIFPDYYLLGNDTINKDTMLYSIHQRGDNKEFSDYYFIYNHSLKIKPKLLTQSIFISNNNYFNPVDVEQTYNRLADLKNYKFININFEELPLDSNAANKDERQLQCNIELSKSKVNSMTYEFEGRNSSGDYGIAGNLIYQNKNMFRGAEIFNLKLKGALEVQKVFFESKALTNVPFFNTYEYGAEASLEIPKFLVPIKQEFFPKYFKPKTTFSGGYNYQNRPDFQRTINNLNFGYSWKQSKYIQHILNPIEINSVKIFTDSAFQAQLNALTDKRLKNQYTNHFILDLKYSFIYSDQDLNKKKDFSYFRATVEPAGNFLNGMQLLFNNKKDANGYYEAFNLVYSQYIRYDMDFRHYIYLNPKNTFVVRSVVGVGIPYGNSGVLPYEKSFFAGGTNDIRAWPLRALGPGAYNNNNATYFDQIGDILLELNVEERFPIYKYLQGAVFADAGNIWLYKPNSQFPGGEFKLNTFASQIAFGTGVGLRIDLSYFIIRVDAALPLKNPAKPEGQRWLLAKEQLRNFVLNFGIGYPF